MPVENRTGDAMFSSSAPLQIYLFRVHVDLKVEGFVSTSILRNKHHILPGHGDVYVKTLMPLPHLQKYGLIRY